jgi:hypothetical protein
MMNALELGLQITTVNDDCTISRWFRKEEGVGCGECSTLWVMASGGMGTTLNKSLMSLPLLLYFVDEPLVDTQFSKWRDY